MKYEVPQTAESEKVIIGSVLKDPKQLPEIIENVTPDDFFEDSHKAIVAAIVDRFSNQKSIDPILISSDLDKNKSFVEAGGLDYLNTLTNQFSKTSITDFIEEVKKKAVLRNRLKLFAEGQLSILENKDVTNVLAKVDNELLLLNNSSGKKTLEHISQFSKHSLQRAFDANLSGNAYTGVISGITHLDNLTSGFQNSDLVIIAAKSSNGKTSLATSMLANHIRFKPETKAAIFSLEMTKEQLNNRFLADLASVNSLNIRKGALSTSEWVRLVRAQRLIDSSNLYIDDESDITPVKIRAKIESLSIKGCKPDVVVVDYIQLMSSDVKKDSRYHEVSHISTSLKNLAKDINRPIIVLSQVSRDSEKSVDKRPNMNQLRESGRITEDADVIIMLYREEVHNKTDDTYGLAEIMVEKQRNGPAGETVYAAFAKQYTRFENIEIKT